MKKKISAVISVVMLMILCFCPQASAAYNDLHEGYATYTGSGYSGGAFLLDPIPSDMEITAINPKDLNYGGVKAALAGSYLEVEGPKGKTIVYVTDLYPEGAPGALDLSPNAFSKIGAMKDGKIKIKWRVIKAPITGNFTYRIKEGSSQWWAAIQVRNHKYPAMKMEYYKDGKWINMEKTDYNHFLSTNLGTGSLKVRITDIRGKVVKDTIPKLPANGTSGAYTVPGHVQFPE
ncbi:MULTISPECIES: expansin EXLX1 family cellulose-binding protein [Bacillus]|uniref:expansin EXLX1 family cellulose-binding protein n=1 Tax=Bacillus TaxID=1386 RepID=UPI001C0EFA94|nr:expansin EXLX1 family cellulose-binding protein [Bacillus halotolerans]MBU5245470.1 Expansin-YoaJ [Bacillus halotolerans]MEC1602766.1 expansin EXLX1 family cellulose-binding protein [Bacillus halotolerans]MEC3756240.1 expansin EXLX1 family cellulose-binding protein [Bacillus halotolerans]